jgi:hypothetical protein
MARAFSAEGVTSEDLDYLQRTGFEPPPAPDGGAFTSAPPAARKLLRIDAIGRLGKPVAIRGGDPFRLVTEDLLVGLYNYKVPIAFLLGGGPQRANVRVGTWLPEGRSANLAQNDRIAQTALRALYPSIWVHKDDAAQSRRWSLGGLVLGIPTAKPPDNPGDGLPHDRIVRALAGGSWAALVLAQPVDEPAIRSLRLGLINEARAAASAAAAAGTPSPLSDQYAELLQDAVTHLTHGQATGAWRTAVYLLGDEDSYHRLASVWRGVFAGVGSLREPVRIWDRRDVPGLAERWAMPDPVDGPAPGLFRHPFQHQTVLTSNQLAAYVHFPEVETTGFEIRTVPGFDVVAPAPRSQSTVSLGEVVDRDRPTGSDFAVDLAGLTRHAFVSGVTGSGKTNTVFHLLRQVAAAGLPFLVIEPAKTEYRTLITDGDGAQTPQVFTLGDENVSPFRLNPFEVPEGIPVAVHLDLLRSAFNAGFGMWTPLPQVLEICLHRIYADRGWDITANVNRRLDATAARAAAFPTLSDLVAKVELVSGELGYEERVTADIRAALRTRLDSLRTGGKGRMLDTSASLPLELLLGRPTILELEPLGDDDDKAFLMGLILIRLAERRRADGDTDRLRHLLVIEEAHRLLGRPGRQEEGEPDTRGKAVETFTNLLSEVRAYGQGVVVVDQIPAKLAPDIVKNSNLKVAHRIVAGDDRAVLGATMAMDAAQERSLATLSVGQAAVFADGQDAPLLIQVPSAKGGARTWPANDIVRQSMAGRAEIQSLAYLYLRSPDCDAQCLERPDVCELARHMIEDEELRRAFGRTVLSAILTPGGARRTWPDLVTLVHERCPAWIDPDLLLRGAMIHAPAALAARQGARAGWTYADTRAVSAAARAVLEAEIVGDGADHRARALRALLLRLQRHRSGPFLGCERIWGATDGPCLCREPVAELVASRAFDGFWSDAAEADRTSQGNGRPATWGVCQDAAYHLVEFPANGDEPDVAGAARSVALCFGQQMLATRRWSHPATQRRALAGLIAQAGHPAAPHRAETEARDRPA